MEFYFRGHKSPLTLIQGDISGDFRGQYDTTEKKQILGDIMSLMKGNLERL